MKDINPYLIFDGNAREAMTFYKDCLGGELQIMPFSEAPFEVSEAAKDRTLHARLASGSAVLMASDSQPGQPVQQGDNVSISIQGESREEIESIFAALSKDGKVTMPLQDTFWGAHFGMLTDRFGINWMLNFEYPKQA
jgi:PhnB protein